MPDIPHLEMFNGSILHAKDYKASNVFQNKKVAIIGLSFSGMEIAADIAKAATHVYSVAKRPIWILPRYLSLRPDTAPIPVDLVFYSRESNNLSKGVDPNVINQRKNQWFRKICQSQSELCPALAVGGLDTNPQFAAISDGYLTGIQSENISFHLGEIKRMNENGFELTSGERINCEVIIFCTGYHVHIPFFDQLILEKLSFDPNDLLQPMLLYKSVFPKDISNIGFVGMYRGPFFGIMELQARWICMVFSDKVAMPNEVEINKGIQEELDIRLQIPRPQFPHGNYVAFAEELAEQIDVIPDFDQIKLEDPILYHSLINGSFSPASYRLQGFGYNPDISSTCNNSGYSSS